MMGKSRYTQFFDAFYGPEQGFDGLTYEDAKFIYINVRQEIRERGMTLDDVLLEIYLDENFSDQERLDAARLLADGAPPRIQ